jgi:hypothetical protein
LITGERLGPKQWNYWNGWNDWNQWKIQRSFTLNLEPIRQAQGKLLQDHWSPTKTSIVGRKNSKNPISTKHLRIEEAKKKRRVEQVDAVAVCQAAINCCG